MSNKDIIFSVKVYGVAATSSVRGILIQEVAATSWVLNWKGCWLLLVW